METANWTISTLVQKFLDKEIQLPEMQRKYVWKQEKVRALIDSIYKGYPSGSILLWETDQLPETRSAAVEKNTEHKLRTTLLLLDGQQRLTSLATVLSGIPIKIKIGSSIREKLIEVYFNMNHPDNFQEYDTLDEYKTLDDYSDEDEDDEDTNEEDSEHLIFQLRSRKIENKPNWISVTKLFKEGPASVLTEKKIQTSDPNYAKYLQRLMELYNRKENYHYQIQILGKDKSYAEVTDVFVRVNSAGAKLRTADLALAQVTSRWIGSMDLFAKAVSECQESKFDLDEGFLIKCLVSVSTGQNKFKIINKIPIEQLKEDWKITKRGLHFAINFLKENAKIETSEVLPSPFLVIPIVCLAVKNNYQFSDSLERQVLRWFYAASMWSRYSRSSESTLDEDLAVIKKEENPLESMMKSILAQSGRLEVKESDLEGKDNRSAFFVMSYVLARRNNAKDWGSGITFSLQHLGREFKNEYDHIFPRSKLEPFLMKKHKDKQKVKRLVHDIANIAFLTKRNNAIKSNKLPREYFRSIINVRGEEALTAQNITLDDSLWNLDSYEDFLKDRRKRIVQGINNLMKALEKGEIRKEIPLEQILKEGETFTNEFKSSLRWDYKQNKINKELEHPILKTLTAFMNSDGGTLFIGVSKDGGILGIEKDYDSLGEKNWDGWSQAFTNVVNNRIGKEFHKYIKPEPILTNGKTIVKIQIKKSLKETYIDPDTNAEFHIRAGTTTQKLNPKETAAYVRDHFYS